MQQPTPEQERDLYVKALEIAAPIIANMDENQHSKIINHHYQVSEDDLTEYQQSGILPLHALTAMSSMVWESIMTFKSFQDMTLEQLVITPPDETSQN